MAVPKRVVGEDETAGAQQVESHLVSVDVSALVAVYERHVELHAEFRGFRQCVADDEAYAVGHGRAFNPRPGEVLQLVVYLVGVHHSATFKALSQAYCAVSAERPHLKYVLGAYHAHEHLQQPALQVAAGHAPVQQVYVGGAPQAVEVVALRVGMGKDIIL